MYTVSVNVRIFIWHVEGFRVPPDVGVQTAWYALETISVCRSRSVHVTLTDNRTVPVTYSSMDAEHGIYVF